MGEKTEMSAKADKHRVLLVDGNWSFRDYARLALEHAGFEVLCVTTPKEAEELIKRERVSVDVVVSEVNFRGETQGAAFLKAVRETKRGLKVVFVSGYPDDAMKIISLGATHVLKPCSTQELVGKVREAARVGKPSCATRTTQ